MIDCDVHNSWRSAEELVKYIDPNFRDYLVRGELPGPRGAFPHAHRPWLHPEGFMRTDLGQGEHGASDYQLLKEKLLDRYNYDYAILLGEEAIEASTLANPYYATALVKAYNDYLIEEWLPLDNRLKGSLVIAPQDPEGSAAEIRRLGDHPDIVQILMSSGSYRPYGDKFYHPIWEAASEVGLPLAIHLGGQGGINYSPIGGGPTTFYWETHALLAETGMAHLASVIANGCFEKWPNVKFVMIECGVAWVAPILWRLDANWKALRKETPWVKMLPTEYAKEFVRFGSQPLEQPSNLEHLYGVLEAIDGKNTLMYASDYPHWDFDNPTQIKIPRDWRENVFDLNARQLYGLPVKEESADLIAV